MSKINKENHRQFMLRFFRNKGPGNKTKKMGNFILFKHWHGDRKCWVVDLFTLESWRKMKGR